MTARLGLEWQRFASLTSTNDKVHELGRQGAPEGVVVTAAHQTAGRGRLGRRWHSPIGENLYLSVLLRPPLLPPQAPLLSLCAGLALHRAVTEILAAAAPAEPRLLLKWPNDLLAAVQKEPYRKLGGVLIELVCAGANIDYVVVGIGCNVTSTAFPAELAATSLRLLIDGPTPPPEPASAVSIEKLAQRLVAALDDFYGLYLNEGAAPILKAFTKAALFGAQHPPITVHTLSGPLHGIPIGLGQDGDLLVQSRDTGTGTVTVTAVRSGDVVLAPPSP